MKIKRKKLLLFVIIFITGRDDHHQLLHEKFWIHLPP